MTVAPVSHSNYCITDNNAFLRTLGLERWNKNPGVHTVKTDDVVLLTAILLCFFIIFLHEQNQYFSFLLFAVSKPKKRWRRRKKQTHLNPKGSPESLWRSGKRTRSCSRCSICRMCYSEQLIYSFSFFKGIRCVPLNWKPSRPQ